MITRSITQHLSDLLEDFPIIGIVGPRQVGKTTLAQILINKISKESIYIDLELPSDRVKLTDAEFFLTQYENQCVIIDEIQLMPSLFSLIRALVDKNRKNGRFILLGSASPELIRGTSQSLAGRISYVELFPFNLTEISDQFTVQKHWFRGGFPGSLLAKSDRSAVNWLDAFITTYIERDLNMLGLNSTPLFIRKFWTMLAYYHGGIWNHSSFARALGVSPPTVNRYLEFLDGAFIIHLLQPFHINTKKRLVKSPKVYIRDSGILHRLTQFSSFDDLLSNVMIGASWEGYVIEQIRQMLPAGITIYYYRTHDGTECDLVLVKGNVPIASVEIKYSSQPMVSKGLTIAIQDLETTDNFIITLIQDDYLIKENVRVCGLGIFLTKYLSNLKK